MSQTTLEAPVIDVQQVEAEAIYAAEYEQQILAQAAIPEVTETPAHDPNDFLDSHGLGGFRHMEISNPNNPNMRGTVEQALIVCPAFRIFVETIHKSAGEEAAIGALTGMVKPPSEIPKQEPTKKPEIKAGKENPKSPEPKAAESPIEIAAEQPVVAEVRPIIKPEAEKPAIIEAPAAPAVQRTETAAPVVEIEPEATPVVLPLPVLEAERSPITAEPEPAIAPYTRNTRAEAAIDTEPDIPESFFAEAEPAAIPEQPAAEHITLPMAETPEPVSIPLNIEGLPDYTQNETEPLASTENVTELTNDTALPVAEAAESEASPLAIEVDETGLEPAAASEADILPAEPIDLSEEVNALLIELGLNPNTTPEPDYGVQEAATEEAAPEGDALQLPQPIIIENVAAVPPETPAAIEELPIVFQTELAERIETLSIEQVAEIQPVADALLQAAVENDELQLAPAATVEQQAERQAAAEQKLEELCVDLLEALGLPIDNETIKQFSRYLLKTEQFRHILHIGRQQTEEGTHERLRSSLAWLQHLVTFIQDQMTARHQALGWSALQLSASRFAAA